MRTSEEVTMLSLINFRHSQLEAEDALAKLTSLVTQVLHSNRFMEERLQSMESFASSSSEWPIRAASVRESILRPLSMTDTIRPSSLESRDVSGMSTAHTILLDDEVPQFGFAFDNELSQSWVYRRIRGESDRFSIASSAVRSASWSMLSGVSLSDVSNISVLALPISARDIAHGEHYEMARLVEAPLVPRPEELRIAQGFITYYRESEQLIERSNFESVGKVELLANNPWSQSNFIPMRSKELPDLTCKVLEPLYSIFPSASVLPESPHALLELRLKVAAVPDDFSFIHKLVLAWDAEVKKAREQYGVDRKSRSSANDAHIDKLFSAREIDYSDIGGLEEKFKRAESQKKYAEDHEEVDAFVKSVFDSVLRRLNYEMDQLTALYESCKKLVETATAGKEMFVESISSVPMAPAMEILLLVYQKLDVRFKKAFEAVLERDRRLKKLERDYRYDLGQVDQASRISKRFEDAEMKGILEFCRQRDDRANVLMDTMDTHTLRGVGGNQDYMESVMKAVRSINLDMALTVPMINGTVASASISKAKSITTALAGSSMQILQTFDACDVLLNAADYEVSVANAKIANVRSDAFTKLRSAKTKEDNKLADDLKHRQALVSRDVGVTNNEIMKFSMLVGTTHRVFVEDEIGVSMSLMRLIDSEKDENLKKSLKERLDDIPSRSTPSAAELNFF